LLESLHIEPCIAPLIEVLWLGRRSYLSLANTPRFNCSIHELIAEKMQETKDFKEVDTKTAMNYGFVDFFHKRNWKMVEMLNEFFCVVEEGKQIWMKKAQIYSYYSGNDCYIQYEWVEINDEDFKKILHIPIISPNPVHIIEEKFRIDNPNAILNSFRPANKRKRKNQDDDDEEESTQKVPSRTIVCKEYPLWEIWYNHPLRRSHSTAEVNPRNLNDTSDDWKWDFQDGPLNLFPGFNAGIVDVKDYGDYSVIFPFLAHLNYTLCDNEEEVVELYALIAHWFQRPGIKTERGLGLGGEQGTGKSIIFNILGDLQGKKNFICIQDKKTVIGDFNSLISGKTLVFLDECNFSANTDNSNYLKNIITGKDLQINQKYKDSRTERNLMNIVVSTNNIENIFPVETLNQRRYFILHSHPIPFWSKENFWNAMNRPSPLTPEGKKVYFDNLLSSLYSDNLKGLKTLANFFYNLPLGDWRPNQSLITSLSVQNQIKQNSSEMTWFFTVIKRKYLDYLIPNTVWPDSSPDVDPCLYQLGQSIELNNLFNEYKVYAKERKITTIGDAQSFGKKLIERFPNVKLEKQKIGPFSHAYVIKFPPHDVFLKSCEQKIAGFDVFYSDEVLGKKKADRMKDFEPVDFYVNMIPEIMRDPEESDKFKKEVIWFKQQRSSSTECMGKMLKKMVKDLKESKSSQSSHSQT